MRKFIFCQLTLILFLLIGFLQAGVRVEGSSQYYSTLEQALRRAKSGEVLLLEPGTYLGNFLIDRPLTLKSLDPLHPAILDGGRRGTVLEIRSDHVRVEGLNIVHSGRAKLFDSQGRWMDQWGDSAVIVYPSHDILLKKLNIMDCDDGITILGSHHFTVQDCRIHGNRSDGIVIEGGNAGTIEHNRVELNEYGIIITHLYSKKRIVMPDEDSPNYTEESRQYDKLIQTATPSSRIRVAHNMIVDNATVGIALSYSGNSDIVGNKIAKTGRTRKPDYARIKAEDQLNVSATGDSPDSGVISYILRLAGSGIKLTCDSHDNRIEKNLIIDNYSYGIVVDLSHKNIIVNNHIMRNHDGIYLDNGSRKNRITANVVRDNQQCGIGIACYDRDFLDPVANIIFWNDLSNNRFNAYDVSLNRELTRAELMKKAFEHLSPEEKRNMLHNPGQLNSLLTEMRKFWRPGYNRWDNGRYGNHYSNFDEEKEGFIDRNHDGIGERPYHIPGGTNVDHFPLDAATVAGLKAQVPSIEYRPGG